MRAHVSGVRRYSSNDVERREPSLELKRHEHERPPASVRHCTAPRPDSDRSGDGRCEAQVRLARGSEDLD